MEWRQKRLFPRPVFHHPSVRDRPAPVADPPSTFAERTSIEERNLMRLLVLTLLLTILSGSVLPAASGPKIKHVLVISIDGMYSQDLTKWVSVNPGSNLAA